MEANSVKTLVQFPDKCFEFFFVRFSERGEKTLEGEINTIQEKLRNLEGDFCVFLLLTGQK